MVIVVHFAIGLVFGLGLLVSGMTNPAKVLAFLDVAALFRGAWDPSLALVMAGAIAVTLPGYRFVLRQSRPLMGERFQLPVTSDLDSRIVVGPALFGIGWGLAGLCPGPLLASLAFGGRATLLFGVSMLAGMAAARWLDIRNALPARRRPAA
jgi:uncharacterized membrane protein YedE/YeeE